MNRNKPYSIEGSCGEGGRRLFPSLFCNTKYIKSDIWFFIVEAFSWNVLYQSSSNTSIAHTDPSFYQAMYKTLSFLWSHFELHLKSSVWIVL